MDRRTGDTNMLQKEFLMGFNDLPEFVKSFKIDQIKRMKVEFGRLNPKDVCIHAPLLRFIDDLFEALLQRTILYGNCGPSREQRDMFANVMMQKVYNECERNVKRTATERSSEVVTPVGQHERPTPSWGRVSYTKEMHPRRNAITGVTARTTRYSTPSVAPVVPRMASSQPPPNTSDMWVEIRYEKSAQALSVPPLSKCWTLHDLFRKLYAELKIGDRHICAEFKNQISMPSTRYDIHIHNPNNAVDWDYMVRTAHDQRDLVDTTIVVWIEGQEPAGEVDTDASGSTRGSSPIAQYRKPDVDDAMEDVSDNTSSYS